MISIVQSRAKLELTQNVFITANWDSWYRPARGEVCIHIYTDCIEDVSQPLVALTMTTTVDAASPFDRSNADLVIRSVDGVDFRVHKCILAEASPFFESMFSLPQAKSEAAANTPSPAANQQELKHGHPVLPVTEDAKTVEYFLRFCYPYENPKLTNLDEVATMLSASMKYQLETLTGPLKQLLREHVDQSPVRVYALAVRHSMEDEARAAARVSLRYTLSEIAAQVPPELFDLPSIYYQRLLSFMLQCRREFSKFAVDLTWIPMGEPCERSDPVTSVVSVQWNGAKRPPWMTCRSCENHNASVVIGPQQTQCTVKKWWMDFMEGAQKELTERPFGDVVKASALLEASYGQTNCSICCMRSGVQAMTAFINWLASNVDQKTNDVSLLIHAAS
jgi:hypothetical protein